MTRYTKWADVKRPELIHRPWHRRVRNFIRWHIYRVRNFIRWRIYHKLFKPAPWWRIRWRWQRMMRGWATQDCWSLDRYITQVLGESVAYLRDHNHSWPGEQNGLEKPEDWDALLTRISQPLLDYKKHWDWEDGQTVDQHWEHEKKVMADAQEALHLMAEWLPYLWD